MKNSFALKKRIKIMCLLMIVGIFCIIPQLEVHAAADDLNLTGNTEERTNINEPGSSDSREELSELNISNNLTVTVEGGNGQINSTLRILFTLTLIGLGKRRNKEWG